MSANQFQNNKLHAFNTIKRKTGIFLATFLLILPAFFGVAEAAVEGKIKLGATVAPGVSMPDGTGIAAIAATEIFRRMNVPLEIHYYPGARDKYLANEGELDGYLTSTPALLKYFSNIVLVPEPYLYLEMVAVVQKQEIKTTGWKSFENYSVGYIRGQKFIESRLPTDLPNVHVVDNEKQLIGMLDAGRIDCFIILKTVAINIVNNNKALDLKIVSLPFAKMDTYLTLHKKHKSFVPKLVKAITEFKEETASERRSR